MNIRMDAYAAMAIVENQFVHPAPEGSELIFPAPFRAGANRENQFAI